MSKFLLCLFIFLSTTSFADDFSRVPANCNPDLGPVQVDCAERASAAFEDRYLESLEARYRDEGGTSDDVKIKAWCEKQDFGSRNPADAVRSCIIALENSF